MGGGGFSIHPVFITKDNTVDIATFKEILKNNAVAVCKDNKHYCECGMRMRKVKVKKKIMRRHSEKKKRRTYKCK